MRNGRQYLNFISDFWTSLWTDTSTLSLLLGAEVEILNRLYFQAIQVAALPYIEQMPLFREDFWHFILVNETDRIDATNSFTLAQYYESIPFLYDRMFEPTVRLQQGAGHDFTVMRRDGKSIITFAQDPFTDAKNPIRDAGDQRQLLFLAPRVMVDENDLYNLFGYLTRVVQPTSEDYRQLVEGVLRIYVSGPVLKVLNAGLNLAAGYPYSRAASEDRIIGITNDFENYYLHTEQGYVYDVPLIAELSVAVGSKLQQFDTFIRDIRVMDYLSEPQWWRGGPANNDPDLRVVKYIGEDLAPELAGELRDNVDVIDYLFDTYFKFNVIGLRVNTLAIGNFNAIEDFFRVLYEIKPAWQSPYTNAYFRVNDVWSLPEEEVELHAVIDLTTGVAADDFGDGAEHWFFDHPLELGALVQVGADLGGIRARSETAHDDVSLASAIELEEPVGLSGHEWVLGGLAVMGGFPEGHVVEKVDFHGVLELVDSVDTPQDRCQLVSQYDADPEVFFGDTLVA
jgi:hypothetical protein